MTEFLKFFDEKVKTYPMQLEIYYGNVMDWCIRICRVTEEGTYEILFVQNCDIELVFAQAQVQLKEWFIENEGGY